MRFPGIIKICTLCTVVPKLTGEALTWVVIRLKEHKNVRVNKVMKVGMFKQAAKKLFLLYLDVL